jgi:hypothetical protein
MKKIKKRSTLAKRGRRAFRGYPVATIAFYGPDASFASKVAVGIVMEEDAEPVEMKRWFADEIDVRADSAINSQILQFIASHGVLSVIAADGIMGCPHEEGIDYPDGEKCPQCPFWATRDRFTHEVIQ